MKMKLLAAAALLAVIAPGSVEATTYVHYELSGGITARWNIALGAPIGYNDPGVSTGYQDVPGTYPTFVPYYADVVFYTGAYDGLDLLDPYVTPGTLTSIIPGNNGLSGSGSPVVLFSGTTANPTLLLGTYTLVDSFNTSYTLAVTTLDIPAAIPEPATWALMMAGVGVLAAGLRSRRSRTKVSGGISFA